MRTHQKIIDFETRGVGPAVVQFRRRFGGGVEIARLIPALFAWLIKRAEISRQRRRLSELTYWQLEDIGLTRVDVWRECRKSFWRD